MKRILVAALVLLFILPQVASSESADADRLQAAEELARLEYATGNQADSARALIDARIQADTKLEPYRGALLDWAKKAVSWESVGPLMIDFYARHFSAAELREIIAFYRTPTGKKVLVVGPSALTAGVGLAKKWQKEMDQLVLAEVAKEGGAALSEHANRLFDEKKWPEARDAYLKYLEIDPKEVDRMTDLGICYRELGESTKALEQFDHALALQPDHWQSLYNKIILVGFDLGKKAEALELLAKLRVMQPDNPDVQKLAEGIEKE